MDNKQQVFVYPEYHIYDSSESVDSTLLKMPKYCATGNKLFYYFDESEHKIFASKLIEDEDLMQISNVEPEYDVIGFYAAQKAPLILVVFSCPPAGEKDEACVRFRIYSTSDQSIKNKNKKPFEIIVKKDCVDIELIAISPTLDRFGFCSSNLNKDDTKKSTFEIYENIPPESMTNEQEKHQFQDKMIWTRSQTPIEVPIISPTNFFLTSPFSGDYRAYITSEKETFIYKRDQNEKVKGQTSFSYQKVGENNEEATIKKGARQGLAAICKTYIDTDDSPRSGSLVESIALCNEESGKNKCCELSLFTKDGKPAIFQDIDKKKEDDTKKNSEEKKEIKPQNIIKFETTPKRIYWCNPALAFVYNQKENEPTLKLYNLFPCCIFGKNTTGERIDRLFYDNGRTIVFGFKDNNKRVTFLSEVDLDEKLQQIIKNEQFAVALSIARMNKKGPEKIAEINQKRGNSYFSKRKYKEAIDAYCQTIGYIQPSHVITKFTDPQLSNFLVDYLEALKQQQQTATNKQYTTILFNCYTKLNDTEKLNAMIRKDSGEKFDEDTAINILRLSNFKEQALELARNRRKFVQWAEIKKENNSFKDIIEELKLLSMEEDQQKRKENIDQLTIIIKRYGLEIISSLLDKNDFNSFIMFLASCCKKERQIGGHPNAIDFIPIFINKPQALQSFMKFIIKDAGEKGDLPSEVWDIAAEAGVVNAFAPKGGEQFNRPDPRNVWFKEIFENKNGEFNDEQLMLFLRSEEFNDGLIRLYMNDRVKFYEEVIKLEKPEDIPKLFSKVEDNNNSKVREESKNKVWKTSGNLWRFALKHLVAMHINPKKYKVDDESKVTEAIKTMIDNLKMAREEAEKIYSTYYHRIILDPKGRLFPESHDDSESQKTKKNTEDIDGPVPFLDVLDILSKDKKLKAKELKELAKTEFKKRQGRVNEILLKAQKEESEMIENDKKTNRLTNCFFQVEATPCASAECKGVIELPAKHFLCGCSYHMEHLGENVNMCSKCKKEQKKIIEAKKDALESALENFKAPIDVIQNSQDDPLCEFSTMLQTGIMGPGDLEKELADVNNILKEYND